MVNADEENKWAYLLAPTFQCLNTSGKPLTEGWIEVYIHGTRNKYYCASDFSGTLHPFKIPLNSLGANIILASPLHSYDVYVYNKFGSLSMSRYNIVPATNVGEAIADIVTITSEDHTVDINVSGGTTWDLSIKDTTDQVAQNTSDISDIKDDIEDINDDIDAINTALDGKKDKQQPYSAAGSVTKTITNVSQDANGKITVTYSDIDLPAEVPNVEITSPNGTIDVQSSTDVETNTKTFTIDVKKSDMQYFMGYYGRAHYEDRQPGALSMLPCYVDSWSKYEYEGDFITNEWSRPGTCYIDVKPGLYLVHGIIRYKLTDTTLSNTQEYMAVARGSGNMERSGTNAYVYKDWSCEATLDYNTIELSFIRHVGTGAYQGIELNPYLPYGVDYVFIEQLEIVKLDSIVSEGGGGGTEYIAGDAIDITNNTINVKVNPASGIDIVNDELVVKVGQGLAVDPASGLIIINSEVGDVVETVEKLKKDLDTQITPNFDMPNISQVYDFADPSVSTLANGACMLCQAFTIPINHEIRTLSEDANEPTLFGIYSQQGFGHKIMLALYEYTYAKSGEEHGSSTYVGDTGPVNVVLGVNEYPLKNRNPSITELRSDRVYYATLYLPNAARVNGLMLAGAPNYGNNSVPAEPRLSCAVENITWNNQELDMNDPTTTLNHYQTYTIEGVTYYNYYIGPWNSGYNERWTAPRFYMQIRNGEYNVPIIPTVPFVDLGNVLPTRVKQVSELTGFTPSASNSSFRDVTPLMNVTITSFEWVDDMSTAAGWAAANCVYDSGFATNLSGNSNTVTDLGTVGTVDGHTMYAHRITFTTPITLTANTAYRFLCECFESSSSYIFEWATPTDVVHVGNNGWWVVTENLTRYDNIFGKYIKLTDSNNNSYVI